MLTALKNNEKTSRIPIIFLNNSKQMIQNKFNYFETISESINHDRIASLIRKLNPLDRRGNAFIFGPKNKINDSLFDELSDEAWNCYIFNNENDFIKKIDQRVPDILFISMSANYSVIKKIIKICEKKVILKFNNELKASPIFLLSESPLLGEESRQLDKRADQIILHY